jgi:hypothetical protein
MSCIIFVYSYHRSFQFYQPMDVKQLIIDNQEKELIEKIRLEYFANQYKTTFDMTYSPKLAKKYNLSTMNISVDRCLTEQKPLKQKKKNHYNLRRLHQLYSNLNRYDYVHNWTVFNYDYLSAYFLCGEYKMSNLLYEFSIGAHDPNGELRFLLKQFEMSSSIINQYPANLSFELIYRLFPFRDQLPELTYNLLEQCLVHCPLQLITDDQRQQCLAKYPLTNIIYLTLDSSRLFIFTDNDQLYLFYYSYYGLLMTNQFDLIYNKKEKNDKLISFLCKFPYVCCLSSNSSLIVLNCQQKQISTEISCSKLISFTTDEIILIISSLTNSLELWDCSKNVLVSKYDFPDDIIDDCTYKKSIIKVTFKQNQIISYFSLDKDFQFNPIRTLNENLANLTHHILLDTHSEFYYSFNHSQVSLIIYHQNQSKEIINNIDFVSLPISVVHLSQSNSIAWLTSTAIMIFHPLYEENIFKPFEIKSSLNSIEYDVIHDHYSSPEFSNQTNFLACINKTKQIIDIYEWRYEKEQQQHVYRQLTHLKFDISIDQCIFTASTSNFPYEKMFLSIFMIDWFNGITVYCSDGNHLYKYNATMLTYLVASKPFISSKIIDQIPNTHLNEYLTFIDKDRSLKIFTLDDNNTLHLNLSIDSIVNYYFTKISSHILVLNEKNILSIYSLKSSELLWTTSEFQNSKLQIHSLQSSFIIICLQTKLIFQIDTISFRLKNLTQLSSDCLLSTVISNNRIYIISNDQRTFVEFNINNMNLTILPAIQLKSVKINQLFSVSDYLVFRTDDNQIYLWWKETEPLTQLEKASRLVSKDNRLVLVCPDNKTLILYDLKEKLRGTIQLDDNAGQIEAIDLSDNHNNEYEQYLFLICQDRFFRIYCVSNGKQLAKLFIHTDLNPFIGVLNNHLLLKVANRLCIIKIINEKLLTKK